jgi:Domain of unknown function (DUF5069)
MTIEKQIRLEEPDVSVIEAWWKATQRVLSSRTMYVTRLVRDERLMPSFLLQKCNLSRSTYVDMNARVLFSSTSDLQKRNYMDLTKGTPRSVRDRLLGIVQLARTTDKAKAVAHGTIGEYEYNCSMDKGLFDFLGINGTEYLKVVTNAKNDAEIETFVKGFLAKKTTQEIAEFNKQWLTDTPSGESLQHFTQLRAMIAPDRTDVKTWPDLLDLEEGRPIPQRVPATMHA